MIPGGPNNEQRPRLPAVKWPRSEIRPRSAGDENTGQNRGHGRERKKAWVLEETVTD